MKLSVQEQLVVFQAQTTRHGLWATCEPMMEILRDAGLKVADSLWLSE